MFSLNLLPFVCLINYLWKFFFRHFAERLCILCILRPFIRLFKQNIFPFSVGYNTPFHRFHQIEITWITGYVQVCELNVRFTSLSPTLGNLRNLWDIRTSPAVGVMYNKCFPSIDELYIMLNLSKNCIDLIENRS